MTIIKRLSTFWGESAPPDRENLATRARKGPHLTLVWGPRMVNLALYQVLGVARTVYGGTLVESVLGLAY